MALSIRAIVLSTLLLPFCELDGPPFLTDDPQPTETVHWEIYGPLIETEGKGEAYEGAVAAELNTGAASNLQVTIEIPLSCSHDATDIKMWCWR